MRLFVGIELPEAIRSALSAVMGGVDGARWQTTEQLHLTLRFIGNLPEDTARDIDLALQQVRVDPMDIQIKGVGVFGTERKPRALWAGVTPGAPLDQLHQRIESALVRSGLPPEPRKFKAHVTLARFKTRPGRLGRFLSLHDGLESPPWEARNFTLFRSHLARTGAIYEPLAQYPDEYSDAIERRA